LGIGAGFSDEEELMSFSREKLLQTVEDVLSGNRGPGFQARRNIGSPRNEPSN